MYAVQIFDQARNQTIEAIELMVPQPSVSQNHAVPMMIDLEGRFIGLFDPQHAINQRSLNVRLRP
jgi:hypothetical protein